ncbi:hypothetical protein [Amycolatopsis regifaucium]|uniref:Uncharacterized protein n=1 Tax=Amycolatopsis regifaucium TaxID=546365 RepID=A0A154M844_9PSEU|nr:hypothetical protein [Amycolatopsis regifaucium]KZB80603.1 hypothetical protein AVL48_11530 [Amycolatopsis regifaucium]OKA03032.1 hypothetical protein ATP06_0238305 [Amycolatopsis regifaucium]SFH00515.1 hypothetical protein SAMN04489731_10224 [Amycolatopsis regifaucium]
MSGPALFAAGLAWFAAIADDGSDGWEFQPALIVAGFGIGCVLGPMVALGAVACFLVRREPGPRRTGNSPSQVTEPAAEPRDVLGPVDG